jgi:hypothetical protein
MRIIQRDGKISILSENSISTLSLARATGSLFIFSTEAGMQMRFSWSQTQNASGAISRGVDPGSNVISWTGEGVQQSFRSENCRIRRCRTISPTIVLPRWTGKSLSFPLSPLLNESLSDALPPIQLFCVALTPFGSDDPFVPKSHRLRSLFDPLTDLNVASTPDHCSWRLQCW